MDPSSVSFGSLCIITGSRGPAGVCCCSSTWIQLVSELVPCVLLLAVEVLLGCVDVQCWIQLVSELVPCVLLLAVEVLLGCVAAAVLDSASV